MSKRFFSILACALFMSTVAATDYSGTLPVLFINTDNGQPITSKDKYVKATYYLDNLGLEGYKSVGSAESPLTMQIKGRGNYSWVGFDKKPYRLKLDSKQALLGMSKNKHFALMAHADDSFGFLRNPVGFWLSERLGMPWTPAQEPVEVVMNGDYIGLYFLTETIRVDTDRVDIVQQPDLSTDPDIITGGWLVEIDNYDTDPHIEITEGDGSRMIFTYKDPEELSSEQAAYLQQQMETINTAIFASDKSNCTWSEMIDIPTLAKYYIVQEIVDDYESFHGSCYLNKQQGNGQKWMFGPVWDFGSAFNEEKSRTIYDNRYWHQHWIGEMCKYPEFMDEVKVLWQQFYGSSYYDMLNYVQQFADKISAAAVADAARWPQYGNANEQAKATVVKDRLRKSCKWLASQWGGTQQSPDTNPITVYFVDNDPNPWAQVYAYSWDYGPDGAYNLYGSWPGSQMTPTTLDGVAAWFITVTPEHELSDSPGVLFGNGGSGVPHNQTADMILKNNTIYYRDGSTEGINDVMTDSKDIPAVYYNLQGIRVDNPQSGIYIERRGANSKTVLIK